VRHSYRPHSAVLVEDAGARWRPTPAVPGIESAPGLIVFQFGADLFYANAGRFAGDVRGLVDRALTPVRWLIVDAGAITSVDYSAARVLRALVDDLSRGGVAVLLVHAEASLLGDLRRHGLTDVAAPGRAFNTLREALAVIHGAEGKDSV
jgi:MFS superfamily sulfate permease-like transporter